MANNKLSLVMNHTPKDENTIPTPSIKLLQRRSSAGSMSSSTGKTRQQRKEQALQDAACVRWEDRSNFNLCSVVITHHRHVRSASSLGNYSTNAAAGVNRGNHGSGSGGVTSNSTAMMSSSAMMGSSFYFDPAYYFGASSAAQELASNLYDMYDTMVNMQEDFEYGIDWDETPYLQREEPPVYLKNLDMSGVEAHVKRASAGTAANEFSSIPYISSPIELRKQLSTKSTHDAWENTVPGLFFLDDFDLTDPFIFEQVLEVVENYDDELTPRSIDNSPRHEFQKQQDVLTQILDIVESALLEQVKTRSRDFFRESKRFQTLKDMVNDGHSEVTNLRGLLNKVNVLSATQLEPIPREATERDHLKGLENTLISISDIIDSKSSIGGFIAANDFNEAIQMIGRSRNLLFNENADMSESISDNVNLSSIHCLSTIETQLSEYEKLIVNDLSNRLIDIFLSWEESDDSSSSISLASRRSKEDEIRRLSHVLSTCGQLCTVGDLYISRLNELMRETIETIIMECVNDASSTEAKSVKDSTSLTFNQFMECLDLLFGEILRRLRNISGVNQFLLSSNIYLTQQEANSSEENNSQNKDNGFNSVADIAHRSISDLLRQRKELHSLLTIDEIKKLWDSCLSFTLQLEGFTETKVYGLRSTLLAQAKAFVERKHENHMATLVASLDGEKWAQISVSPERQSSITFLCTGRAALSRNKASRTHLANASHDIVSPTRNLANGRRELIEAEVEGSKFKLVWSCLVLVEMIMTNISCAAHFQTLASNIVGKVTELMRLFNSRTTQLVLGAGALHSSAKLKSINAKHLALVTQSLGMLTAILPHIRAALMAQLPTKQHTLLMDLDRVKKDYAEHTEKCLAKFVSIVGSIVERALAPTILSTDFDQRAASSNNVSCCKFLDGIVSNTRKMYQVLKGLLPRHDLQDVYSRIFAYVDQKVPSLFIAASVKNEGNPKTIANSPAIVSNSFSMPRTFEGKMRMIKEVELMTEQLQFDDLLSWSFSAPNTLRRHLGIEIPNGDSIGTMENNSTLSLSIGSNESGETSLVANGNVESELKSNDTVEDEKKEPSDVDDLRESELKSDGSLQDGEKETSNIEVGGEVVEDKTDTESEIHHPLEDQNPNCTE